MGFSDFRGPFSVANESGPFFPQVGGWSYDTVQGRYQHGPPLTVTSTPSPLSVLVPEVPLNTANGRMVTLGTQNACELTWGPTIGRTQKELAP